VPNASSSGIQGVNKDGIMVGSYADQKSVNHGFIFANGQITTVDGPNAVQNTSGGPNGTELTAISNSGLVVGDQRTVTPGAAGTYAQAFSFQNQKFTIFNNVQASNAIPNGVNSAGVVVGVGDLVGCPFIFTPNFKPSPYPNPTTSANGSFAHFTVPGTSGPTMQGATTQGINKNDQLVGSYAVPNSSPLFFGWMKTGSNYCSLSVPGAKLTEANDVNDSGLIVGLYQDAAGVQHGFLAN
jgi:hypothetical protein